MIKFTYPDGATPLDPDEAEGLIPSHMHLQTELNEWEQENILLAENWIVKHRFNSKDILTIDFAKKLHKKMFEKTWKWAGCFRKSNKNIGVDWQHISEKLKILNDDVIYQLSQKSFNIDEIATRFHHRLVSIHPFCNGNGRHARLMTDLLLNTENQTRFTWGQKKYADLSHLRKQYIQALKAADSHNYEVLLTFVRD